MPRPATEIPDEVLALLAAPGAGAATIRRLLEQLGSYAAAAGSSEAQLAAVPGIGPARAAALRQAIDGVRPPALRATMQADGATVILRGDDDYPPLLAAISDPPAALWIRGRLDAADRLGLAVVGSRRCTAYGREQAGRLAALLAQCGLTIVSGGAVGIDAEAHRAALRVGGRTIAVLGCGLDVCYPPQHRALFEDIVAAGSAVISEHPMGAEPRPGNFPHRNRIISGLSLGVLVIEAARRSGALITARCAAVDQGREAMVLPGRVDSPASAGCLAAARQGWAALVTSHADVLEQLEGASHLVRGAVEVAGRTPRPTLLDARLTAPQQAIVDELRRAPAAAEIVAARASLPLSQVLADLTLLEIRGVVRRRGGEWAPAKAFTTEGTDRAERTQR